MRRSRVSGFVGRILINECYDGKAKASQRCRHGSGKRLIPQSLKGLNSRFQGFYSLMEAKDQLPQVGAIHPRWR